MRLENIFHIKLALNFFLPSSLQLIGTTADLVSISIKPPKRKRIFLFLRVYDPRFRRGHDPILRCSYGKSSDPDSQVDVIH
jgi:hypothetical protein